MCLYWSHTYHKTNKHLNFRIYIISRNLPWEVNPIMRTCHAPRLLGLVYTVQVTFPFSIYLTNLENLFDVTACFICWGWVFEEWFVNMVVSKYLRCCVLSVLLGTIIKYKKQLKHHDFKQVCKFCQHLKKVKTTKHLLLFI